MPGKISPGFRNVSRGNRFVAFKHQAKEKTMNYRLLVVDDESAIRYTVAYVLTRAGYLVTEAKDGQEALEMIEEARERRTPFDLLLTDLQMPRMTGTELIAKLKKNKTALPTIVLSGTLDEELIHELLKDGCSGYLPKPFDFTDLVERVETVLHSGRRKELKEIQKQAGSNWGGIQFSYLSDEAL